VVILGRVVALRNLGFMANRQRQQRLAICRKLLNASQLPAIASYCAGEYGSILAKQDKARFAPGLPGISPPGINPRIHQREL
jgi:hypothetical protein